MVEVGVTGVEVTDVEGTGVKAEVPEPEVMTCDVKQKGFAQTVEQAL